MSTEIELDWKAIFLGMPYGAAILDSQGTIIAGNNKIEELLGLRSRDYIGKNCSEVFHEPNFAQRPKACPFERMVLSGKTETAEMYLQGLGAFCICSCSPYFDAKGALSFAVHSFTEITEHKRQEEALLKGEERLRNVINGTNAGTWEWNIQTGEAQIDERSAAILGYSLEELEPLSIDRWMQLKHPEDMLVANQQLSRHARGETEFYTCESRMRHKDGSWVWVIGRGKVIEWDARGAPLRMFGTHIDITERKRSERKIRDLLEEKDLILKEVHHRIKNNMSTIFSFLNLQAACLSDASAVRALGDAAARVQSMLVLYDKLYQHSQFRTVSLSLYVPSLVDEIASNSSRGATVRIEKDIEDISLDIKKAQALGIIINELVTNAMKYAFEGRSGGTIRIAASRVESKVRFSVEDDGVGLPEGMELGDSGGFGFTLVSGLAKQLGARMSIERIAGTKVVLEFET